MADWLQEIKANIADHNERHGGECADYPQLSRKAIARLIEEVERLRPFELDPKKSLNMVIQGMVGQIENQKEQIARLKERLVEERARQMVTGAYAAKHVQEVDRQNARAELAKEMPEWFS